MALESASKELGHDLQGLLKRVRRASSRLGLVIRQRKHEAAQAAAATRKPPPAAPPQEAEAIDPAQWRQLFSERELQAAAKVLETVAAHRESEPSRRCLPRPPTHGRAGSRAWAPATPPSRDCSRCPSTRPLLRLRSAHVLACVPSATPQPPAP